MALEGGGGSFEEEKADVLVVGASEDGDCRRIRRLRKRQDCDDAGGVGFAVGP